MSIRNFLVNFRTMKTKQYISQFTIGLGKDHFDEILKMKANGKTKAEIVKILNKKYHRGANVNALKTFLKRNHWKQVTSLK